MPNQPKHKPWCASNIRCLVNHEDGVCPGFIPCNCGVALPKPKDMCECGHLKENHREICEECGGVCHTKGCLCSSFRPAQEKNPVLPCGYKKCGCPAGTFCIADEVQEKPTEPKDPESWEDWEGKALRARKYDNTFYIHEDDFKLSIKAAEMDAIRTERERIKEVLEKLPASTYKNPATKHKIILALLQDPKEDK